MEDKQLLSLIEASYDSTIKEVNKKLNGPEFFKTQGYNSLKNLIENEIDRERTERIAGDETKEKNIIYLNNYLHSDLNTLIETGTYIYDKQTKLKIKNLPKDINNEENFKLVVDNINSDAREVIQTLIILSGNENLNFNIYVRYNKNGILNDIWTEWRSIINNATPTIEDLDKNVIHLNRTNVDSVTEIGTDAENPDNLNSFNAYDKTGEYYCLYDNINNVLNKPDKLSHGFRLIVMGASNKNTLSNFGSYQIIIENFTQAIYIRYHAFEASGSWNNWERIAYNSTVSMLDSSLQGAIELITGQVLPDYCVCGPAADKDYIDLATIKTPGNYYSPSRESANDNILLQSVPEKMITSDGVIESGFRLQVILTNHSVVTSNKTTTTYHAVYQVLILGANNYDTTLNRIFFRSALYTSTSTGKVSNLSWTPWQKITTDKEFDNLDTNTIHFNSYRHAITLIGIENVDTSVYNNLDNIIYKKSDDTAHEFFCYKSNIPVVKAATPTNHFPKTLTRAFRVFDLMLANYTSAKSDDTYGVQIIIEGGVKDGEDASIPSMFIRYYNTITPSFSEWREFSYLEDVKGTAALSVSSRYNTLLTLSNTSLPLYESKININALPVGSYHTGNDTIFVDAIFANVLPEELISTSSSGIKTCKKSFTLWVMNKGHTQSWMQILMATDMNTQTESATRPLVFIRHAYGKSDPTNLIWSSWFKLAYDEDVSYNAGNAIYIDNLSRSINVLFNADKIALDEENQLTVLEDESKLDKLIAGNGIAITEDSVISATTERDENICRKINAITARLMNVQKKGQHVQQYQEGRMSLDDRLADGDSIYVHYYDTAPDDGPITHTYGSEFGNYAGKHGVSGYSITFGVESDSIKRQIFIPNNLQKIENNWSDEYSWNPGDFVFMRERYKRYNANDREWEDFKCLNGCRKKDLPWYNGYNPIEITLLPSNTSSAYNVDYTVECRAKGANIKYQWQYSNDGGASWNNSTARNAKHPKFSYVTDYPVFNPATPTYLRRCKLTCADDDIVVYSNAAEITATFCNMTTGSAYSKAGNIYCTANIAAVYLTQNNIRYAPDYLWQSKTDENEWINIEGATTTTLNQTATGDHVRLVVHCNVPGYTSLYHYGDSIAVLTIADVVITTQPQSLILQEGEIATFNIVATGGMSLSYKWYYSPDDGATWSAATNTGYNTDTYSIEAILDRNGYKYKCRVKDTVFITTIYSDVATLTIDNPESIMITQLPLDITTTVGTTVSFNVVATGNNLAYKWQVSTTHGASWNDSTATGCKTDTVSFKAITARNGYQWRCILTDAEGNTLTSNAATLTVGGGSDE